MMSNLKVFDGVPIEWNFLVQAVPVSMHTSLCLLNKIVSSSLSHSLYVRCWLFFSLYLSFNTFCRALYSSYDNSAENYALSIHIHL